MTHRPSTDVYSTTYSGRKARNINKNYFKLIESLKLFTKNDRYG